MTVGQQSNPEYVASAFKESAEYLNLVARVRAQVAEEIAQALDKLASVVPSHFQYRQACTTAAVIARSHAGEPVESVVAAPARSACPQCAEHGTPARVGTCGPACHEAHTYTAQCDQAR